MMGKLFVVATPIGNFDDITLRAVKTLSHVDLVAAEDTRTTGLLLSHLDIKVRLISLHQHNEEKRSKEIILMLKKGSLIALVSDAGTPAISDPGYRLVSMAVKENIQVIPIPGVSAVIAALSVSGLATDSFIFQGFVSKKTNKRTEQLKKLSNDSRTMIFYESPKRILRLVSEIYTIMGNRDCVIAREITKPYEEFIRGSLNEIIKILERKKAVKGECTLIVTGKKETVLTEINQDIKNDIINHLSESVLKTSILAGKISAKYGLPKKMIYNEILHIKEGKE